MEIHKISWILFWCWALTLCTTFVLRPASAEPRLELYNVDPQSISVSGISSGAAMTTQMHVIHSSIFMGAGIIAGVPFACAGGAGLTGALACMNMPAAESITYFETLTSSGSFLGNVDSARHLSHSKVFIFSGTEDTVVLPGNGPNIERFYRHFHSDVKTVFDVRSEHCMPTDSYGGPCATLNEKNGYMSNCGYNAAFELLNFIYGGHLVKPDNNTALNGEVLTFDQTEFFHGGSNSMDTVGYVYIPSRCRDKLTTCKLHMAIHGCKMGRSLIGLEYVNHGGYNAVAELNNIIVLYPQVMKSLANPNGCWDWWGYSGSLYATKYGNQIRALFDMVIRISHH